MSWPNHASGAIKLKPDKSQQQKFSIKKRLGSFRFAFNGLRHALLHEHNFRIHLLAGVLVVIAGFYFRITKTEWIALIFAIGFVLVTELLNTTIELIADFISPGENKIIGRIKDIAAGAVLIAVLAAVAVGLIILLPYLCALLRL